LTNSEKEISSRTQPTSQALNSERMDSAKIVDSLILGIRVISKYKDQITTSMDSNFQYSKIEYQEGSTLLMLLETTNTVASMISEAPDRHTTCVLTNKKESKESNSSKRRRST